MNTFKTGLPGAGRGWGPWWLLRSAGRYLVALLVVSPVVASLLPLRTRFGGGGELGYLDGVGSLLAATWLCFALVGWVWVLLVLLVLLPMRRRMEAPTFRGLAWYLLSAPTPLAVLVQVQPVNVLVIHVVAHAVFAVWLLPVPGPLVTANGREEEGDVRVQVVGG
ncbi:hypothetical protein ACH4GK_01365 [Streptomyces rimosus]|uniref:hypothetical protein n=1 Tax=Streptomyces rimosus TaxID=1927 RepID=UPI0004CB1E93|nr:hypothetical protein [Streptomyces rimosus]